MFTNKNCMGYNLKVAQNLCFNLKLVTLTLKQHQSQCSDRINIIDNEMLEIVLRTSEIFRYMLVVQSFGAENFLTLIKKIVIFLRF